MNIAQTALSIAVLTASTSVFANDCSTYPHNRGSDVIAVEGSAMPKIVSTARTTPFSDDISDVDDAYDEATLMAKAEIAKFLGELVASSQTRDKVIDRMSTVEGDDRQAASITMEKITKSISSDSQALLRGVVVLGDCYTPGKEVRVTVGLKPETLAMATGLADATAKSINAAPTATTMPSSPSSDNSSTSARPSSGSSVDTLRRTSGHSNTSRLDNF